MNRWQPREATWKAAKTFLQTFAGTMAGQNLILDSSALNTALTSLISSGIAAVMAFAMNLEASPPSDPVAVTITGEPVEVTTTKRKSPKPRPK